MVGDTENLAPVPTLATLPPTQQLGPEQPARSPVLPEKGLSADDANTLFGALFPGLMALPNHDKLEHIKYLRSKVELIG